MKHAEGASQVIEADLPAVEVSEHVAPSIPLRPETNEPAERKAVHLHFIGLTVSDVEGRATAMFAALAKEYGERARHEAALIVSDCDGSLVFSGRLELLMESAVVLVGIAVKHNISVTISHTATKDEPLSIMCEQLKELYAYCCAELTGVGQGVVSATLSGKYLAPEENPYLQDVALSREQVEHVNNWYPVGALEHMYDYGHN